MAAAFLPSIACGPDGSEADEQTTNAGSTASTSQGTTATTSGGCGESAGERDSLCEILADYAVRCNEPPPDREQELAECQSENGGFEMRLSGCFYSAYAACARDMSCGDLEACVTPALMASDPESFDFEAADACEAGDETACDQVAQGVLRECFDLFQACDAWDDLCLNLVMLTEPYRSEARDCLNRDCGELEACVNAASGTSSE
jgi:hypothetical protein